jgi:hypothetical protein
MQEAGIIINIQFNFMFLWLNGVSFRVALDGGTLQQCLGQYGAHKLAAKVT